MSQSETWTGPSGTEYELVEVPTKCCDGCCLDGGPDSADCAISDSDTIGQCWGRGDGKYYILRRKESA